MSAKITATIGLLRSISEMREQFEELQAAISTDLRWSMPDDYRLFVQHPVTCPYCEEEFENNRSYLVDTTQKRVRAIWKGSKKSYMMYSDHPHVSSTGAICFGGFPVDQPSGPLFTGLNPDSAYCGMKQWLQNLGHDCPEMQDIRNEDDDDDIEVCQFCDREFSAESDRWYGWSDALGNRVCWDCRDENVSCCAHCDEEFDNRSDVGELIYVESVDTSYCENCLNRFFTQCDVCYEYYRDGTVVSFTDKHSYSKHACETCLDDISTEACTDCYRLYETEDGPGICPRCTPSDQINQ